jgi:hypothetical protein
MALKAMTSFYRSLIFDHWTNSVGAKRHVLMRRNFLCISYVNVNAGCEMQSDGNDTNRGREQQSNFKAAVPARMIDIKNEAVFEDRVDFRIDASIV